MERHKDTGECCRELDRVLAALGINGYNGKSASENVLKLRDKLKKLEYEHSRCLV